MSHGATQGTAAGTTSLPASHTSPGWAGTTGGWTWVPSPAIRPGPHLGAHREPRRCRWRDSPGRAPRDHRGDRPCHPVVVSPELVAHGTVLGEVPEMGGWYGLAKHPGAARLPGVVVFGWKGLLLLADGGRFRDKVRRLARERPRPGSFCGARWSLTSVWLPPECSRLWKGSSMIAVCMWRWPGDAVASGTWCAAVACAPCWTGSAAVPVSLRSSVRSAVRPWTALCRPVKGCCLREHRP